MHRGSGKGSAISTSSAGRGPGKGEEKKKTSFIEQAKKRKECDRLTAYIMKVDLMMNSVLHQVRQQSLNILSGNKVIYLQIFNIIFFQVVVNSMTTIQDSIRCGLYCFLLI